MTFIHTRPSAGFHPPPISPELVATTPDSDSASPHSATKPSSSSKVRSPAALWRRFRPSPWWPWICASLSGVLLAFSFPPLKLSGLIFVALIPLLCAVWLSPPRKHNGWFHFRLGYCTGLWFFTTTFYWLAELAPLFHNPFLHVLPLLLALYLALFPAAWAWFAGWIARNHFIRPTPNSNHKSNLPGTHPAHRPPILFSTRNLALALVLASSWTTLEWLRNHLFTGFGWNPIGVALYHPQTLALIQIAEFTGVGGLSFLLTVCNVIILLTILRLREEIGRTRLRPHFDFSFTVALFVLVLIYGARLPGRLELGETIPLRVAAIQPNIPQSWKIDPNGAAEHETEIFERLAFLHSLVSRLQPDLVLWPEAVIPGGMLGSDENVAFVKKAADEVPALLLGTDDFHRDGNCAALLFRNQPEIQFYAKQHLVPFGEYLPMRPILDWAFGELVPGDFTPGSAPAVFSIPSPGIKITPLICFEDTLASLSLQPVRDGAQVLVNLTNDAWFGRSAAAEQHLMNAVFRAVETRRPLVRCTNTGITAFVDVFGGLDTRGFAKPFTMTSEVRQIQVAVKPPLTFYTRHGDVFTLCCAILWSIALVVRLAFPHRTPANPPPTG